MNKPTIVTSVTSPMNDTILLYRFVTIVLLAGQCPPEDIELFCNAILTNRMPPRNMTYVAQVNYNSHTSSVMFNFRSHQRDGFVIPDTTLTCFAHSRFLSLTEQYAKLLGWSLDIKRQVISEVDEDAGWGRSLNAYLDISKHLGLSYSRVDIKRTIRYDEVSSLESLFGAFAGDPYIGKQLAKMIETYDTSTKRDTFPMDDIYRERFRGAKTHFRVVVAPQLVYMSHFKLDSSEYCFSLLGLETDYAKKLATALNDYSQDTVARVVSTGSTVYPCGIRDIDEALMLH